MRLASIAILISLGAYAAAQQPKKVTPAAPKAAAAQPAPKSATAAKMPAHAASAQKPAPKKVAVKPAAKPASHPSAPKPSAAKTESKAPEMTHVAGRRDPFISPVRLQDQKMKSNPACSTGSRCLVISQVVLKGVVKTPNGMIAMVENGAKKAYNLHERDVVQNGSVSKITGDSVVFQENGTDPLGRPVVKEVVKRVTVPAV
jgi:hypothetical protein